LGGCSAGELVDEPVDGGLCAEETDGHEQSGGDGCAAKERPGADERGEGRRDFALADGKGGGFGVGEVGGVQEIGDEGELVFVLAEEGGEDFGEGVGIVVAEMGLEAEDRESFGTSPGAQCDGGVHAGFGFFVGEEVDEGEDGVWWARGGDAEGGEASEFGGGVDGAVHDGFVLVVPGGGEVEVGDVDFPVDECFEGGGFAFAAWVAFGGIFSDQPSDDFGELGSEFLGGKLVGEFGGDFDDEAVEVFGVEDFGEGGDGLRSVWRTTKLAEGGEVRFGGWAWHN